MNICFIANNNIDFGLTGGDRIFTELIKGWKPHAHIQLMGCQEAIDIAIRNQAKPQFLKTAETNTQPNLGIGGLLIHTYRRLKAGIKALNEFEQQIKNLDIVYSVSDFYPDFYPAYLLKRRNPKIMWIAGYYLFAPAPWAKDTPYKGRHCLRGLVYWLMQRPSYYLVNKYADKVFVTSEPDVKHFITAKRSREQIIVVQGGVDVTASEEYLKGQAKSDKLKVETGNSTLLREYGYGGRELETGDRPLSALAAVALAREADLRSPTSKKYDACFVGRFHYQKGVLLLIDIWKKVCEKRPEAKLAMIGNGPLEAEAHEKIKSLGLERNIELLGFMDGEKKFEVFKQSKVMVHPATYDSGGMAAAEGMAWRLPGVSFDLEALKTYYPQGMVKIPCYDEQQFAEAILHLLHDHAFYDQQAQLAHELILSVWDWRKRAEFVWQAMRL
jgi:glycosyltransferase involved in cell wall biosynthesis